MFAQASPATKTKILSYAVTKKYKKGEYVFRVKEKTERIYIVISGYAVLERINRNNNKRAVFVFDKGNILNEIILERPEPSINCYALTNLEVVSLSRQRFLEIMESDFGFTKVVLESMSKKIRRLYHQVENTTKMMRLDKQVASRLWKYGRDFGIQHEGFMELPFAVTITFLAELVGSNQESVSRVIREFSRAGILTIRHGTCRIYDMEKLVNKINEP